MLLISASCNCSQRELRTPPLLSVIIPHTLVFAVRQEVFLSSDEGVLSSSSLSHSLLPPLSPTLFFAHPFFISCGPDAALTASQSIQCVRVCVCVPAEERESI